MSPDRPVPTSVRRARILERIQQVGGASLAELAAEHAVSDDHRAPRPRAALARRARRALPRRRARGGRAGGRRGAAGHRVGPAAARGARGEGRDRVPRAPDDPRRGDDLPRRDLDRLRARPPARGGARRGSHHRHHVAGDRARARRRHRARDRGAGRGRPAHARDRGRLDRRVPAPDQGRRRLRLRLGLRPRARAHDGAAPAGRHARRRAGVRRPGRRARSTHPSSAARRWCR